MLFQGLAISNDLKVVSWMNMLSSGLHVYGGKRRKEVGRGFRTLEPEGYFGMAAKLPVFTALLWLLVRDWSTCDNGLQDQGWGSHIPRESPQ